MNSMHRPLNQLFAVWRWKSRLEVSAISCRSFCSTTAEQENPIEVHKRKLFLWFSHLPQEEKQFRGYFTPENIHVDPFILETKPEERVLLLSSDTGASSRPAVSVQQLLDPADGCDTGRGLNVLLYGAVGTGKSTVVRKMVLDWCSGTSLTQFKLLIPFACEDLCKLTNAASLRSLVSRKYLHLKGHPLLSGEGTQARDVLFLFNGMEKMSLDFRMGSTELCSDPNEVLPAGVVVVNLLRKYLLPEASVFVTTRLSALDHIPRKYVSRYAQICGFNDPDRQRAYFTARLLQQSGGVAQNQEAHALIELLYLNLQREGQLAAACFLPSYCWLTCATLQFLRFTEAAAPIRTLTGIYTSFLRLNFGGEVLDKRERMSSPVQEANSLMMYVVRTVGKLAYDGVKNKRTSFAEEELEQWIGGKMKTDEELRQLAMFKTDVVDFFMAPCVESSAATPGSDDERRYVFAVPAMQEYLAALYVVLGEDKSALEKLSKQVSLAIGQVGEDAGAIVNILSKFIPLRIFAVFNLLELLPKLYEKILSRTRGSIARVMAAELFRSEDSYNDDILDQVEQTLLGVHGPKPQHHSRGPSFELYPIFMGGLLHYGNRILLQQLGCSIQSNTVSQITRNLRKYLVRELNKPQPPEELMDLLLYLYEFQNPRLTAEVLASIRTIRLSNIRMTSLKCLVLSSVLSCTPPRYQLAELDLSSCLLSDDMLHILKPAFRHTRVLNLQFNSLGPDSCILLRDLLLDPNCPIKSLQLCDNPLSSGFFHLLEALPENQSLRHLSLMHTCLGDQEALQLAERLEQHTGLQELNVAYNNIGDDAALALEDTCREHPTIHTVHLYLNPLSEVGRRSLYLRCRPKSQDSDSRRVHVLTSVTEGSDISKNWLPILSVIRKNAASWDKERVKQQLQVFLRDLEWGRQQQQSLWKRLQFRRVARGVQQMLQKLENDSLPPFR